MGRGELLLLPRGTLCSCESSENGEMVFTELQLVQYRDVSKTKQHLHDRSPEAGEQDERRDLEAEDG